MRAAFGHFILFLRGRRATSRSGANGRRKKNNEQTRAQVVRGEGGGIVKRLEETVDGFPVVDRLRELLLCPDSELAGVRYA